MSASQINWLQNTALDFTGKTDIDKWKVLVLSHTPLDWNTSTQQAATVLDNYASSGSGAKIIGNIHGHVHNCNVGTIGTSKIARIAIPQVCADRYNEYSSSGSSYAKWGEFAEDGTTPIYYYKGTGNATDTMFCVVVIDCENEKFYAITFGATTASTSDGNYTKSVRVREITFTGTGTEEPDEPVIPDEPDEPDVPDEPEEPENIIDTVGYSDNTRVSSSGSLKNDSTASGLVCTGFIPFKSKGDVYETSGVNFDATTSGYCCVARFESDKKTLMGTLTYPTQANPSSTLTGMNVELDSNGNLKITITSDDYQDKYFVLCGVGSGANLVVTKNA